MNSAKNLLISIHTLENLPMVAKYPLPKRWNFLRKQFFEAFHIGSQPMIKGRSLICSKHAGLT